MKKRTLPLLLLLAGLSAATLAGCGHEHAYEWKQTADGKGHWQECVCGDIINDEEHKEANADGKCPDCGADLHVHAPEWKSDATKHWQECECGEIVSDSEGSHKDENSDDACDDCTRAYFAVSFEMHDHGTAPAAQKIISGGAVKAPDTPADEDAFKFKGWFKDAEYKTAFDFEKDTIDAATTIHAKWEEDATAGASKAHAHVLTKEVENLQTAKKGVVTYFKYVAEEAGRFTVSLGIGVNSQNATFTTSLTGDAVYGKDHADSAIFDMEKDQTVYVLFTFLGEEGEDITAGVMIGDTIDEPLPEDHFLSGEYEDEEYTISITFDRETKKLTYFGVEYPFTYVGGSVDSVYFTQSFYGMTTKYTVHYKGDGTYSVSTDTQNEIATMHLFVAPDPIALSAITGYYEPKEDATYSITELYIYASESETSTSVRYNQGGFYYNEDVEYDTAKNRLTFSGNVVTINLAADGTVASISVGKNIYERKGEAGTPVPSRIDIEWSSEYVGATYEIKDSGYGQSFGNYPITVTAYDAATGIYTVSVYNWQEDTDTTYKLTVSEDGNTITLYDEDGEQIDTLTIFEYIYHDFPAAEEEISIAATDFQKGCVYLFTVETAGWYAFTDIPDGVSIYYNLNEDMPLETYMGSLVREDAVYLAEGCLVGVFVEEPEATTFTVAPAQAPAGWEENNPKIITEGPAKINDIVPGVTYYFTYTVGEAGTYLVNAYFDDGDQYMSDFIISYSIDGTTYDFDDYSATDAITEITAAAGDVLKINVIVDEDMFGKSSVTVSVVDGTWLDATDVTLTGEPEGDEVTVSATVASGTIYYLASTKGSDVTVTGSAAFTVKFKNGEPVDATEEDGTFTAVIPAGEEVYFTIVSETEQEITLSQTFAKGTQGYPIAISMGEGANTLAVTKQDKYFTLPAGNYIFTSEERLVLANGGVEFTTGSVIEVKEGDVLSCKISLWGSAFTATLTIQEAVQIFTAEQAGTYTYEDDSVEITLIFDKFGVGSYDAIKGWDFYGGDIIIAVGENNTYTFTYLDEISDYWNPTEVTVTFTFVDGKISILDSVVSSAAVTLERIAVDTAYTGEAEGFNFILVLNEDLTGGKYMISDPDPEGGDTFTYTLTIAAADDVDVDGDTVGDGAGYIATYYDSVYQMDCTVQFQIDGDEVHFFDDGFMKAGTLTKEA